MNAYFGGPVVRFLFLDSWFLASAFEFQALDSLVWHPSFSLLAMGLKFWILALDSQLQVFGSGSLLPNLR